MKKLIVLAGALIMLNGCLSFGASLAIQAGTELAGAVAGDIVYNHGLEGEQAEKKQDGY